MNDCELTNDDIILLNTLSACVSYPLFVRIERRSCTDNSLSTLLAALSALLEGEQYDLAFVLFLRLVSITALDKFEVFHRIERTCTIASFRRQFMDEFYLDLFDYCETPT